MSPHGSLVPPHRSLLSPPGLLVSPHRPLISPTNPLVLVGLHPVSTAPPVGGKRGIPRTSPCSGSSAGWGGWIPAGRGGAPRGSVKERGWLPAGPPKNAPEELLPALSSWPSTRGRAQDPRGNPGQRRLQAPISSKHIPRAGLTLPPQRGNFLALDPLLEKALGTIVGGSQSPLPWEPALNPDAVEFGGAWSPQDVHWEWGTRLALRAGDRDMPRGVGRGKAVHRAQGTLSAQCTDPGRARGMKGIISCRQTPQLQPGLGC